MRMKAIFRDLLSWFANAKPFKKCLVLLLFLIHVFLLAITFVKVDYEVLTPGSINPIVATNSQANDYWVVKISTDNRAGNVNTVGVYQHIRVSYFQYLISKLSPKHDVRVYDPETDLSPDEEIIMGTLQKEYSIVDALIVAYEAAKAKNPAVNIEYSFAGILVLWVRKDSRSNLEPGDLITKIDGRSFGDAEEFRTILSEFSVDETFRLTVLRGGKETEVEARKMLIKNEETNEYEEKLGVGTHEKMVIDPAKTTPKFQINEKLQSRGPSGGAMMALSIYNALLEEDVTKGKMIIGTGTINLDGSVGAIGGVPQKIATAAMYAADVFFVGEANYEEALEAYEELKHLFKPGFKLIEVKTFSDIISELEALS